MEDKFCNKCGKELVKRELSTFNTETGKKDFKMGCPTEKCDHYGNDHNYVTVKSPGWFGTVLTICSKCGEPLPYEVRI